MGSLTLSASACRFSEKIFVCVAPLGSTAGYEKKSVTITKKSAGMSVKVLVLTLRYLANLNGDNRYFEGL